MAETYDVNSIQSLSFREGVRTRIQMYLGSDDIEGTYQALKEIINNSTDEALAGSQGRRFRIKQTHMREISHMWVCFILPKAVIMKRCQWSADAVFFVKLISEYGILGGRQYFIVFSKR